MANKIAVRVLGLLTCMIVLGCSGIRHEPIYVGGTSSDRTGVLLMTRGKPGQVALAGHLVTIDDEEPFAVAVKSEALIYLKPGLHKLSIQSFQGMAQPRGLLGFSVDMSQLLVFGKLASIEFHLEEGQIREVAYTAPWLTFHAGSVELR